VFYDNNGGGFSFSLYGDEAGYNYENRLYNNVFYENRFAAISINRNPSNNVYDNIVKNNILYGNDFVNWNGVYDLWGWTNADGNPFQIWAMIGGVGGYVFENNDILYSIAGEEDVISHADYYEDGEPSNAYSLYWWESNYPSNFLNNIEITPGFVDADNHDFNLQDESPMIDNGTFLTSTVGVDTNTIMQVEDVSYFFDGFGISGEQGDLIQLDDGSSARIISIDYDTNTLTLDSSLSWSDGQGVSLAYEGSAPDIGAYESNYVELESGLLSFFSRIWNFIKSLLIGDTNKAITGNVVKNNSS